MFSCLFVLTIRLLRDYSEEKWIAFPVDNFWSEFVFDEMLTFISDFQFFFAFYELIVIFIQASQINKTERWKCQNVSDESIWKQWPFDVPHRGMWSGAHCFLACPHYFEVRLVTSITLFSHQLGKVLFFHAPANTHVLAPLLQKPTWIISVK